MRKSLTCGSLHRWNLPHCSCVLSVGLASSASCHRRCHLSRYPNLTCGASVWRRRCHCRWPEPEESQCGSSRSLLGKRPSSSSPTYPLVWTSASGQHEDVLHFPLLLLFLDFAPLIFGDDIVPFSRRLFLQLGCALFHGRKVCYLHQK